MAKKRNDRNVCASLRKRLEDSVRDAEKLDTELKQRPERLIDANNISSIKKRVRGRTSIPYY